ADSYRPSRHVFPLLIELETRLELATARLQVGCATNCATPARPRRVSAGGVPRGRVHILTGPTAALLTTVCTVETPDVPGLITRPLARLGIRKSALDRAVEPPLSPMAPVDLDDDAAVTGVLNLALAIASILLRSAEHTSEPQSRFA